MFTLHRSLRLRLMFSKTRLSPHPRTGLRIPLRKLEVSRLWASTCSDFQQSAAPKPKLSASSSQGRFLLPRSLPPPKAVEEPPVLLESGLCHCTKILCLFPFPLLLLITFSHSVGSFHQQEAAPPWLSCSVTFSDCVRPYLISHCLVIKFTGDRNFATQTLLT